MMIQKILQEELNYNESGKQATAGMADFKAGEQEIN
jgi:hypothetical protein